MNDPFEQYLAVYITLCKQKPPHLTTKQYLQKITDTTQDVPLFWRNKYTQRSAEVMELKAKLQALSGGLECSRGDVSPLAIESMQISRLDRCLAHLFLDSDPELRDLALNDMPAAINTTATTTHEMTKTICKRLWSLFICLMDINYRLKIFKILLHFYISTTPSRESIHYTINTLTSMVAFNHSSNNNNNNNSTTQFAIIILQTMKQQLDQIPTHSSPHLFKLKLFSSCHGLTKILLHSTTNSNTNTNKNINGNLKFNALLTNLLQYKILPTRVYTQLTKLL